MGERKKFPLTNLHGGASPGRAQVIDSCDFTAEPDAARAVDAPGHDSLHQGTDVLVLHRSLARETVVHEAASVAPERHRLVLQITLATCRDDHVKGRLHNRAWYKKRLVFHSGSKVENSLQFTLSQCCESKFIKTARQ